MFSLLRNFKSVGLDCYSLIQFTLMLFCSVRWILFSISDLSLHIDYLHTDCPQKITIGIWVSIAKDPFMESDKSNRIIKL